jgi:CRISPR/Cas system CSM-associated protein Csm3 (group 7 of RAMP superfamily)
MPRKIRKRFVMRGTLEALTPVHVGGLEQDFTDLSVAVDGSGRFYVPGTSLAGVFRSWLEQAGFTVRDWWGYQEDDKGEASRFVVDDAEIALPSGGTIEVRDGVGIDRKSGAAAYGKKYDMAVIPRGARIPLRVSVDVPESELENDCEGMLGALVAALNGGLIRLGACRTRGMGKVKLNEYTVQAFELNTREGMLAYLFECESSHELEVPQAKTGFAKITVKWSPAGPMMVKAGYDGVAVDMLPLTGAVSDQRLGLVLPGSSIKGALRSHAERIMRTLLGQTCVAKDDLLDQVKVPIVDILFGAARESEKRRGSDSPDAGDSAKATVSERFFGVKPGAGCLLFSDCYSETSLNASRWENLVQAGDQNAVNNAIDSLGCGPAEFQQAYHVAVDRWTNAVKEGALYTVLEPHGVKWQPIEMVLSLWRVRNCKKAQKAVQALLLLTLRDLSRGVIPLGFGVNRGMGDVNVDSIEVSGEGLNCRIEGGEIEPKDGFDIKGLSQSWSTLIDKLSRSLPGEGEAGWQSLQH